MLVDGIFIVVWGLTHYIVEISLAEWKLSDPLNNRFLLGLQIVFAIATVIPIIIHIARDIAIMIKQSIKKINEA